MRVVMFAFWGRKANVELQLPFIRRILEENPEVEFHGWDLTQRDTTGEDSRYLRSISDDQIRVISDFGPGKVFRASNAQNKVWAHYTNPRYRDCTFVKIDDDDLFFETDGFADFVRVAQDNPNHIVSALTVNNGCSTRHIPELWAGFEKLRLIIPRDATPLDKITAHLLGVHRSTEYAKMCHSWFHQNWRELCERPAEIIPTDDWLSINCIAMSAAALKATAGLIRMPPPRQVIGGRPQPARLGDEGAANAQDLLIYSGFVCAHATFGPQIEKVPGDGGLTEADLTDIRKMYADVARQYLGDSTFRVESNR